MQNKGNYHEALKPKTLLPVKSIFVGFLCLSIGACTVQDIVVASVSTDGTPVSGSNPSISLNGRFVAFESQGDLIYGVSATHGQCYVRDLLLETTEMVSVSDSGKPSAYSCRSPSISEDGRYVAFQTIATNLVNVPNLPTCRPGGTCPSRIYIRDRLAGITLFVSKQSNHHHFSQPSIDPAIVPERRIVFFTSSALLPLANNPSNQSVFSHAWSSSTTKNVTSGGNEEYSNPTRQGGNPSSNRNGTRVAVESTGLMGTPPTVRVVLLISTNLPEIRFVSLTPTGAFPNGDSWNPSVSPGGNLVAFTSSAADIVQADTNGSNDIFLYSRAKFDLNNPDFIQRISVSNNGSEANGNSDLATMGLAGKIAYESEATNLVDNDNNGRRDIFLRDAGANKARIISHGRCVASDGDSSGPSISAEGTEIAFTSDATNLIPEVTLSQINRVYVYLQRRSVGPFEWIGRNVFKACTVFDVATPVTINP